MNKVLDTGKKRKSITRGTAAQVMPLLRITSGFLFNIIPANGHTVLFLRLNTRNPVDQ